MSFIFSPKIIRISWWILTPLIAAKILLSVLSFYCYRIDAHSNYIKSDYDNYDIGRYTLPKVLDAKKNKRDKVVKKRVEVYKLDNITLKACYISNDKKFIVVEDGLKSFFIDQGKSYHGSKLVEVGSSFAIFKQRGKFIELRLSKPLPLSRKSNRRAKKRKVLQKLEPTDRILDKSMLQKYLSDPQTTLSSIRFEEIRNSSGYQGIYISYIKRYSIFDRMGLKRGDIIKSINGKRLHSMMDLLPYYEQILQGVSYLKVGFQRDGKRREIIYEID